MDKDKDNKIITDNTISTGLSSNNRGITMFFTDNPNFIFVHKKTEKIATAVYLVTNFFSDNEPIKWVLRQKITDVLSFITNQANSSSGGHENFSNEVKIKFLELVSILNVASKSGLISQMNFSILESEFTNLIEMIESKTPTGRTNNDLSGAFFNITDDMELLSNEAKYHSAIKSSADSTTPRAESSIKDTNIIKDISLLKKTNRQEAIVNLLKKRRDLSVKDISQVIRGCSEKTIQRELIALISSGVVDRSGERRWSRYSLKNYQN